jgi:hypothetical protein
MPTPDELDELKVIFEKLAGRTPTDEEIEALKACFKGNQPITFQVAKYINNVNQAQDSQFGDRFATARSAERIDQDTDISNPTETANSSPEISPPEVHEPVSQGRKNTRLVLGLISMLLLSLPVGILINHYLSIRKSPPKATFADWCKQRDTNQEARHMVAILLKEADTQDCDAANKKLSERKELDLSDRNPLVNDYLKKHNLNSISNIEPLSSLTQLTQLDMSGQWQLKDINPLRSLTHLKILRLKRAGVGDGLTPLQSLSDLEELDLSKNGITDISPLSALKNLKVLVLSDNYAITDVTPLESLQQLTKLDISKNKIKDVRSLSRLTNLTTLDLSGNPLAKKTCPVHETPSSPI